MKLPVFEILGASGPMFGVSMRKTNSVYLVQLKTHPYPSISFLQSLNILALHLEFICKFRLSIIH